MKINIIEYLEETCSRNPEKIALKDSTTSITFKELKKSAEETAKRISTKTDAKNSPIAVFLPKTVDAIVAFAGIIYSKNFYVPLDTKTPRERLASIFLNLSPALVLTKAAFSQTLQNAGLNPSKILILDDELDLESLKPHTAISKENYGFIDTDPAYVIYTSGSTGTPKGVVITHKGVIDYIEWARSTYKISGQDKIGNQAPLFFDNSTLDIYLCFSTGATLYLIPDELFSFPIKLVEQIHKEGVTTIFWVPSIMTSIANFDIFASLKPVSLKKILFAGEVMPARTLNYWRRHLPSSLFSNLYGPTEITVDCTYYIVDRPIPDDEPVPIGYPCRNSDILILNERNQAAEDGEIGELCVRGSSLALGYWNAPDKSEAAFVQNPLRPQYPERIYRTGDLVQRNTRGEIIFLGRKDSQIKHQGYRIELGEIETAASLLEGVRTVCVLYNQPKQEITLFYEAAKELPVRNLRDQLSQTLPRYMIPAAFKWLASMPMNANGKTDRQALAHDYF